jgi:hypothetical protein
MGLTGRERLHRVSGERTNPIKRRAIVENLLIAPSARRKRYIIEKRGLPTVRRRWRDLRAWALVNHSCGHRPGRCRG